jgi:predicted cupin superfamily sugar epimerase
MMTRRELIVRAGLFVFWLAAPLYSQTLFAQDSARAQQLIQTLGLRHLNAEAGLFSVIRVSDLEVTASDGKSPASNAIYYMLTPNEPINYVHRLFSDDYQTLIEGGPADYYLFYADGRVARYTLGRDISKGQVMMVPSPAGTAKAIILHDGADYLLVSSILSPAWSPQRSRIGGDEAFVKKYANQADWATPPFIKHLIGPNFGHALGANDSGFSVHIDASGQMIWQGMQLTEKQVLVELNKLATAASTQVLRISIANPAQQPLAERLRRLANDNGIQDVKISQTGSD